MNNTPNPSSILSKTDMRSLNHFINGAFHPAKSGKTFENINPATGECIAHVALGDKQDIDLAVEAAQKAFKTGPWPKMAITERCHLLKKVGDLILERLDDLALAETLDTGKPIVESREGDIPRSAQNFHFFADYASSQGEESFTLNQNERHFTVREPLGVVGLITPWNLPLYLATWKIAPCLAMGNTCILKPAEWTPTTATILGEVFQEAGIPPGVFNIVHGFGQHGAGELLTTHPDVRAISFTGETTTGKAIMSSAAQTLKKLSFELGGKGANIIFEDADLEEALPTAIRAAYRNQGEICLAGSRLLVEHSIYNDVLDRLLPEIQAIRVGNPQDLNTQMGAIISPEQLAKVQSYITLGAQEGNVLCGGERLKDFPDGNFLTPALIADVPPDSRIATEEIFGPVLTVTPFKSEEEAISIANNTPYGLSTSIWSQDVNRCHRVSSQIQAGIIWVNCWFSRDLRTPFGGQKSSGIGREGGRYSLEFFSELKTICYRYGEHT
ncbi:MAG: aldehyde dehydrogenase [Vampirovibrio sp.]|nr:aldehyde dehydrogenase [Vampirovibrio sp.]